MKQKYDNEIGIDEAGRGCLAGPVVAGSFLIPPNFKPHKYLNDSKQMTADHRDEVFNYLKENYFLYCGVGIIDHLRIDEINILQSTFDAMHAALDLNLAFQQSSNNIFAIVDGNRFRSYPQLQYECIPKADATFYSVAAASVLAKVTRDNIMKAFHNNSKYTKYNFAQHKGYGTKEHYELIEQYGISDIHRKTFRLTTKKSLKLF
jgi:ribonuclease HII